MTTAKELGKSLAAISNQQSQTKNNLSPDDTNAQLNANFYNTAKAHSQQRIYKYTYSSTAFIIDHPIQGAIDSAVYEIDGGYSNTGEPVILSVTNDNDTWYFRAHSLLGVDSDLTSATVDTTLKKVVF